MRQECARSSISVTQEPLSLVNSEVQSTSAPFALVAVAQIYPYCNN